MSATRYIFDAPVQALLAGDRIIRCPEPTLADRTVVFVRTARGGETPPAPFGPVAVVTADATEEEPVSIGWGTRCVIERVDESADVPYLVTAREPLGAGVRLSVRSTVALELTREEWPVLELGGDGPPHAGTVITMLIDAGALDAVPNRGEVIDAYWYVDGIRVETPREQSAREAADLFASQTVRLHPAGIDAGETCPSCGQVVSWLEHLPPVRAGEYVRCMVNVPRAV